jgi:hypothetical protein
MRIVLGETAHAHQPVQRARGLIAVHDAELGYPIWQFPVGPQAVLENLDMARAVHRLDGELALVLGHRGEHVLAKCLPVPRGLPQRLVEDLRPVHLAIADRVLPSPHVIDETLKQLPALRVPEDDSGALFLEVKEIHLATQLAMVALLRFLDLPEISRKLLLDRPGGAVDPLQLCVVVITAPVRSRELGELERLADVTRGRHVRAAAQIEPLALLVDLELFTRGDCIDEFNLEQLALLPEEILRLLPAPELLRERCVTRDDLVHLGFDLRHIVGMKRLRLGKVVKEAVLDHGADGHLRARPQRLHGFGHHVRRIVTNELQRFGVCARHDFHGRIGGNGICEIGQAAVHNHRHGALCQRLGNAFGEFLAGDALAHQPLGAIGKCYSDLAHGLPLTRCIPRR